MAGTMRSSGFLPTVKCSNCGMEIEISMMGEHICSEAPPLPQSNFGHFNGLYDVPNPSYGYASSLPRATRLLPHRIDAAAANQPYLRADRYSPNCTSIDSRGLSPLSPKSPRHPSFTMPPRSATAPLPLQPPSPELIAQDCPFPPFPTAKPLSSTPTSPTSPAVINHAQPPTPQTLAHRAYFTAPLSARNNGGRSVLQRMNTIAPGPFNVQATKVSRIKGDHKPPALNRYHERFAEPAPSDRSGDFDHSSYFGDEDGHIQRPSTAGTETLRKLSLSSISGGPRSLLDRRQPAAPSLPLEASPPRPVRPNGDAVLDAPSLPDFQEITAEPLRHEHRAHAFPIQPTNATPGDGATALLPRRPSVGAPRTRRPTVSAANRPLDEIGSVSSYKSSKFPPSPPEVRTGGNDLQTRLSNEGNNTVPGPVPAGNTEAGNPYHTSTESTSSNGSVRSDMKSGSSRSSPPLSDASLHLRRKPSDRMTRINDLLHDAQEGTKEMAEKEERRPARRVPPLSFSRPLYARPLEQPPGMEALMSPPESPMDPAIKNGVLSPISHPHSYPAVPPVPELPAQIPVHRPPARRGTSGNKGNCRGCGEVIKGKSVSSADGRLSGRYHKQCFVCKTCKQPFQTADFYVLENHPYCERHYHELNGSLCKACDGGIEGQCLETELKQKFHPDCFTCQDCRKVLRDDYFEMNGRTYCEQHAFRAAQQTSLLGPGRRHPERRTTKLMMMM